MKQLVPALFAVGAIMALTGAAVYITGWNYAPYIYTIGAGFIALAQVNTPVKGKSKILKRLRIQQIFVNPEKPDVPLNKNDAFQKVQKRRVQEKR